MILDQKASFYVHANSTVALKRIHYFLRHIKLKMKRYDYLLTERDGIFTGEI